MTAWDFQYVWLAFHGTYRLQMMKVLESLSMIIKYSRPPGTDGIFSLQTIAYIRFILLCTGSDLDPKHMPHDYKM